MNATYLQRENPTARAEAKGPGLRLRCRPSALHCAAGCLLHAVRPLSALLAQRNAPALAPAAAPFARPPLLSLNVAGVLCSGLGSAPLHLLTVPPVWPALPRLALLLGFRLPGHSLAPWLCPLSMPPLIVQPPRLLRSSPSPRYAPCATAPHCSSVPLVAPMRPRHPGPPGQCDALTCSRCGPRQRKALSERAARQLAPHVLVPSGLPALVGA